MFARMLRPRMRRHERVPYYDEGDDVNDGHDEEAGDNSIIDNSDTDGGMNSQQQQEQEPTIVALGGDNGIILLRENSNDQQQAQNGDSNNSSSGMESASPGDNTNGGNQSTGTNNESSSGVGDVASENETERDTTDNIRRYSTSNDEDSSDVEEEGEGVLGVLRHPDPTTHPFLTDQIQSERELRYRRQSTCTLIILFFLVRLWIEAIIEKNVGMVFMAIMGTTWTYRWLLARRERNVEYDRQMEENMHTSARANASTGDAENREPSGADAVMNFDPDLGLMSFQAQLALAILESQRQMFENGGYGGNERIDNHSGAGVTEEARSKWKKFEWKDDEELAMIAKGGGVEGGSKETMTRPSSSTTIQRTLSNGSNYGSVSTVLTEDEDDEMSSENPSVSKLKEEGLDCFVEEPSCSICLSEYEKGDAVTQLPCTHLYHESCIASWTNNHVRCPLCNLDLMEGFEQPAGAVQQEQRSTSSISLSAHLGRRGRYRRSNFSRRMTRFDNAVTLAAMEDSIV